MEMMQKFLSQLKGFSSGKHRAHLFSGPGLTVLGYPLQPGFCAVTQE